jgi:hypothetical protein
MLPVIWLLLLFTPTSLSQYRNDSSICKRLSSYEYCGFEFSDNLLYMLFYR